MSDSRKHRLINEACKDLCSALLKLSRVSPDAAWHVWEGIKAARRSHPTGRLQRGYMAQLSAATKAEQEREQTQDKP